MIQQTNGVLFYLVPPHVLPPWVRQPTPIVLTGLPSIVQRAVRIISDWTTLYRADDDTREEYWERHPTSIGWLVCGDERINPRKMTGMPAGASKNIRVIGARFEAWWAAGMEKIERWVEATVARGDPLVLFATYHYSASENSRLGCAGWSCDTAAARAHQEMLREYLEYVWGDHLTVIVVGIETDRDVLTFHGPCGELSGAMLIRATEADVRAELKRVFPDLRERIVADILPYIHGNARCVADLMAKPRELHELDHAGRIIAIGHGFEMPRNEALIVNDIDHNLGATIAKFAGIIERNLEGTTTGDDALTFTCVPYAVKGIKRRKAIVQSLELQRFASELIQQRCPRLCAAGRFRRLVGIIRERDKRLEIVDAG
jgi:hypothetical protein